MTRSAGNRRPLFQHHDGGAGGLAGRRGLERGDGIAEVQGHAIGAQFLHAARRPFRGRAVPSPAAALPPRVTASPLSVQLLGHFESDVAAADHHGAAGWQSLIHAMMRSTSGMFRTAKWPGAIDSRDRRLQRRCAGGKNQRVVGLVVFASGGPFAHLDAPGRRDQWR